MIVPLVLLVGGLVAVAFASAKEEVRIERWEITYKEEQELAKEERQEERRHQEEERRQAREEVKRAEDRALKLEDRDEDRRRKLEDATYLVPYYQLWVGQDAEWTLKALPHGATLHLESVSAAGLKFRDIPGVVPFDHVEEVETPQAQP
jgi:superfamily II DNA/RNA helicase